MNRGRVAASSGRARSNRLLMVWALALAIVATSSWPGGSASAMPLRWTSVPVLAYYYIWFDPSSWNRAKTDYPTLGRYSSDDPMVMRQHIIWAKEAGIDGFIVSWKNTEPLSRRLAQLVDLANAEDFHLEIIYQGRNFSGQPLPVQQIGTDLDYFIDHFGTNRAFNLFERPVVIWSGTSSFDGKDIASIVTPRRKQLLVLASEHNTEGYLRLSSFIDGNAYYWSSVDPVVSTAYETKLADMGRAVHDHGGLWFAPTAVGFDARLIGGTRVIDRRDGVTLQQGLAGALRSSPDAVGLISWNEFSENSYVEPSQTYGRRYLDVLSTILKAEVPAAINGDSSEPAGLSDVSGALPVLIGTLGLITLSFIVALSRRRRSSALPRASESEELVHAANRSGASPLTTPPPTVDSTESGAPGPGSDPR
jgi:hypothetical protein